MDDTGKHRVVQQMSINLIPVLEKGLLDPILVHGYGCFLHKRRIFLAEGQQECLCISSLDRLPQSMRMNAECCIRFRHGPLVCVTRCMLIT